MQCKRGSLALALLVCAIGGGLRPGLAQSLANATSDHALPPAKQSSFPQRTLTEHPKYSCSRGVIS
jgi:hypothetical protein